VNRPKNITHYYNWADMPVNGAIYSFII